MNDSAVTLRDTFMHGTPNLLQVVVETLDELAQTGGQSGLVFAMAAEMLPPAYSYVQAHSANPASPAAMGHEPDPLMRSLEGLSDRLREIKNWDREQLTTAHAGMVHQRAVFREGDQAEFGAVYQRVTDVTAEVADWAAPATPVDFDLIRWFIMVQAALLGDLGAVMEPIHAGLTAHAPSEWDNDPEGYQQDLQAQLRRQIEDLVALIKARGPVRDHAFRLAVVLASRI